MKKKLIISEEGKQNIERLALTLSIGLLTMLKSGIVSTEEAENFFFNPYSAASLKLLGVNKKIEELIVYGAQLGDIERLIPEKFPDSINKHLDEALELAKNLPNSKLPTKKWIDE
ncbi:MAG: DUF3969 family protein [Oscillospiraceae bacterium]|nr:DUF3969 family protein [Oscillospiraceae bacterium]